MSRECDFYSEDDDKFVYRGRIPHLHVHKKGAGGGPAQPAAAGPGAQSGAEGGGPAQPAAQGGGPAQPAAQLCGDSGGP